MMSEDRPGRFIVLVLLLPIVYFWPNIRSGGVLLPLDLLSHLVPSFSQPFEGVHNPHLSDLVSIYYPWTELFRSAAGIPLWNPYSFCGSPLTANAQNGVLFPLTWLYRLLPWGSASILVALTKMWFCGVFAFLYYRRIGFRSSSALLGSATFMFCGHTIVWLGYPTSFPIISMPFLFWSIEKFLRDSRMRTMVWVSLGFCLLFIGGQPQTGLLISLAAALYFALRLFGATCSRFRLALGFLVAAALGICLAGPQILPFAEYLHLSAANRLRGTAGWKQYPWFTLVSWIMPRFFGDLREGNFWGFSSVLGEAIYVGAIPAIFSALGLMTLRKNAYLKAVLGVFLLGCMGLYVEPLFRLYCAFPLLANIDNNKLVVLVEFGLISFAVSGFDLLQERADIKKLTLRWLVVALCCLVFTGFALYHFRTAIRSLGMTKYEMREFGFLAAFLLIACFTLWLFRDGRLSGKFVRGLLLLVTVADLFRVWIYYYPSYSADFLLPKSNAISYLQASAGYYRFVGFGGMLPPELSVLYRLQDARGYDGLTPYSYYLLLEKVDPTIHDLWRRLKQSEPDSRIWTQSTLYYQYLGGYLNSPDPSVLAALRHLDYWSSDISSLERPSLLSILGVRYILSPKGSRPLALSGFRLIHSSDADIWENNSALPRAFVVTKPVVVSSNDAALAAISAHDFAYSRTAVITEAGSVLSDGADVNDESGTLIPADIRSYGAGTVEITANVPKDGWLILSDLFYPGWEATVDGRITPISPGNFLFRAVKVPSGSHRVKFVYRPASFRWGMLLALAASSGLLGMALTRPHKKEHL